MIVDMNLNLNVNTNEVTKHVDVNVYAIVNENKCSTVYFTENVKMYNVDKM